MVSLKEKIHSMKYPIENKRALFAVGLFYFVTPIVAGWGIMQLVNSWSVGASEEGLDMLRKKRQEVTIVNPTYRNSELQRTLDEVAARRKAAEGGAEKK
eukprot:tig00001525_g9231.t1